MHRIICPKLTHALANLLDEKNINCTANTIYVVFEQQAGLEPAKNLNLGKVALYQLSYYCILLNSISIMCGE